jgi:hypothetical protein
LVEKRRETARSLSIQILKKPCLLAELDRVRDGLLQRPAAPPEPL